jgi:hypothetical protein
VARVNPPFGILRRSEADLSLLTRCSVRVAALNRQFGRSHS